MKVAQQEVMSAAEYRAKFANIWKRARKYRNITEVVGGERFDSRKEARRHHELLALQIAGDIQGLERQVPFDMMVNGILICKLIIDWTYMEGDDQVVAEDCKSPATAKERSFRIKLKLARALYPQIIWRIS